MSLFAQIALANFTTKGEDVMVNTFTIDGPTLGADAADYAAVKEAFRSFYDDVPAGQADSIADYMSGTVVRSSALHGIKLFQMDAGTGAPVLTPFGSPDYSSTFAINSTPNSTVGLPNEVALVLSTEAVGHDDAPVELGATRPRSRRKGRIYLGPWSNAALVATANQEGRPQGALISVILAAFAGLRDDIEAIDATWRLGHWSRSLDSTYELQAASIDNSFDVVRSRSMDATSRTRVLL